MLAFSVSTIPPAPAADATTTPLMRQYAAAKRQNPDALLFFRMGDFYELFFEDAQVAARELQITLTARDRERFVPMCGVPYHAADTYLSRLLRKGYRVAICEQMEDPKLTKKIVRREVTRVLTPGTAVDPTLASERNNYLAALHLAGPVAALALLDLSTGDFRATEFTGPGSIGFCIDELIKAQPSEVLLSSGLPPLDPQMEAEIEKIGTKTRLEEWVYTADYAIPLLERQMGANSLEGFGLASAKAAAIAAGAVVHYARSTQQIELQHINTIRYYERAENLQLDAVTVRNLELIEPLFSGGASEATLYANLDCCMTPMGKRLLRASLVRPLIDRTEIESRLEAVAVAERDLIDREHLRKTLGAIQDMERMLSRISLDSAGPRDAAGLGASLARLPDLHAALQRLAAPRWLTCAARLDLLEDLRERLERSLLPDPPVNLSDGGAIAAGVDAELDELRSLGANARQSITTIEERERRRTGIHSLKVRFNNVFGYSIEVTRSNLALVPPDYERKQTLANAERFTTPELKRYEVSVLTAHERSIEIEKRIFSELRQTILQSAGRIRVTSGVIAEVDLLANFAHLAALAKLRAAANCTNRRTGNRGRPPSGGGVPARKCRAKQIRRQRPVRRDRWSQPVAHHRAQHGWQIHLPAAGRAAGHHGADGLFRSRQEHASGHCRPHLHPHRRQRQRGSRPLHLYGGNDRDRHHPQHRYGAVAHPARRNGPRHRYLRRALARLGDARISARASGRENALRHPLSRAHPAGRTAAGIEEPASRRQRDTQGHRLSARHRARSSQQKLRHRSGAPCRPTALRYRARPAGAAAA